MSIKQKYAIAAPLILTAMMIPLFRLFAGIFGSTLGWYLGLVVYWLVWGIVFPLLIIGKQGITTLATPRKGNLKIAVLVAFPLLMALASKFLMGMAYPKENVWVFLLLLSTAFGNGLFEEVLWRGVYAALFPDFIFFRIIWPSIWFALWHYAPGSVSPNTNLIGLMIGAGVFGFYLSFLVKKTNTIWWGIVIHALGGIIMIL